MCCAAWVSCVTDPHAAPLCLLLQVTQAPPQAEPLAADAAAIPTRSSTPEVTPATSQQCSDTDSDSDDGKTAPGPRPHIRLYSHPRWVMVDASNMPWEFVGLPKWAFSGDTVEFELFLGPRGNVEAQPVKYFGSEIYDGRTVPDLSSTDEVAAALGLVYSCA